ncbi:MAG: glucose-6-phosphate dehydrogenase assembly protein OpcA [Spirochaetaceae bacterium]
MNFDPGHIERELAEIQKRSSPTEARTAILNLLVVTDEQSRSRAEQALGAVLGKRAARVLHITDSPGQTSDISLSARCYLDHEHKSVCFQEVLVENGDDGVGAAPGSWTPLLIRDIPVYVLWLADFTSRSVLLAHVREQADKLIFDTERALAAGDPPHAVREAVVTPTFAGEYAVSDFSWRRSLPLRRATAHSFDPAERTEALSQLRRVELHGGPRAYGGLYLAWIASRLGWQPASGRDANSDTDRDGGHQGGDRENLEGPVTGRYSDREGRIAETVHQPHEAAEQGLTVSFAFFDRPVFELKARSDGCIIEPDAQEETASEHRAAEAFNVPADGQILLQEIDAAGNDPLYLSALELFAGS